MTLLFVRIDLSSGTIQHVNAGHPSGYVLNQSGDVKAVLGSGSPPLAIVSDSDFPVSDPIELAPDDLIVLVTDGVLEARSPDNVMFGKQRMLDIVRANREQESKEIIESLQGAVCEFTGSGKLEDDSTIVVIKVETLAN